MESAECDNPRRFSASCQEYVKFVSGAKERARGINFPATEAQSPPVWTQCKSINGVSEFCPYGAAHLRACNSFLWQY